MQKLKLTYFNVTGPAEPARFLLAYAGIEYEDVRIEQCDWPALKSNYTFEQLPLLEIDGHVINQHLAITRYAAKQAKLTGKNDLEDAIIDAAVDSINEFKLKVTQHLYESDATLAATIKEKTTNEVIPSYTKKFESVLDQNGGYFALGRLTWADVYFAALKDTFVFITEDFPTRSEKLCALVSKVCEIPKIKSWIESRPVTIP